MPAMPWQLPDMDVVQGAMFVERLSLKLFGCNPGQLPSDLRQQLTGWLDAAPAGAEGVQIRVKSRLLVTL